MKPSDFLDMAILALAIFTSRLLWQNQHHLKPCFDVKDLILLLIFPFPFTKRYWEPRFRSHYLIPARLMLLPPSPLLRRQLLFKCDQVPRLEHLKSYAALVYRS